MIFTTILFPHFPTMKALQARLHSPFVHPPSPTGKRHEPADISPLPADLRPLAHHTATALVGPPGRQSAPLRQARRLQQRPGLWRQQDAQARIPHPRSNCRRLRHAGVDWRHPVQPDAPGGCRGGAPGHEVRAGAGELGELFRRGVRPRGQHRDEPHHGRRCAPGCCGL